jgi:nucleoid-associated protein YgaU
MGLFDFARDIGKRLFGGAEDPAERIKAHIEASNPGIEGLQVSFEDGKVKLSGNAQDPAAMEKAVLMAGNVEGVAEVDASAVTAPVQAQQVEYYIIQKGDTLWAIAKKYLGSGSRHAEIFEANREVIQDPNLIFPGQKIRIPLD